MRLPAILLCLLTTSLTAQTTLAFTRAQHLRRGINLSMWYAQSSDYSPERLENYTTTADFELIHNVGFDHVRLSINPEPLIAETTAATLRPEALARLDHSVQQITSLGLVVILDIHPEEPWKRDADASADGALKLLTFWRRFAQHFASTDPGLVYFEILNEPSTDVYRWAGLQARLVAEIRAVAPQHTIIATGGSWGGLDDLLLTEPVRDDNVIYSFHDYEPFTFTHQGASWMGPVQALTTGVPYPSSPEIIDPLLAALPDEAARIALKRYGEDRWNKRRIQEEIGLVADWAQRKHVPIYCGEFGAYKTFTNPADRARWLRDMREVLEQYKIGWDMWDYQANFGIVTKTANTPTADPAIVDALGLHSPN